MRVPEQRVRTFHARRGRRSSLTESRLATLLPRYAVPAAVLAPPGTPGRPPHVVLEIGCGHGAAAVGYAATHPDTHACYATHWLEFLLARGATDDDAPIVAPMAEASASGASVQTLMMDMFASDAFRYRADEASP